METITLYIPNISCHHCIMTIKREGSAVEGIEFIGGDPAARTVTFQVADDQALRQLKVALAEIGYPAQE